MSTIILLGGCARYNPKALVPLTNKMSLTVKCSKNKPLNNFAFEYHIFSKSDCLQYLDRNVISKGYQPIHITFINNTDRYFYLSPKNFSFPCVSPAEVADKVHTSTIKRATSYGILALFIPIFIIPAVVDGVNSSNANINLDMDFERKSLHEKIVKPYEIVNGLIFVPINNFNPIFSFSVYDMNSQEAFLLTSSKKSFALQE